MKPNSQPDRRRKRSKDPYRALCLQLEYSRALGGLDALVLAMRNGLLVAGAGEDGVCTELGAVAPLWRGARRKKELSRDLHDLEVAVRPVSIDGEDFYLASIGRGVARDAMLRHSMLGVRRILAA